MVAKCSRLTIKDRQSVDRYKISLIISKLKLKF